jgi:glutamate racemase
MKRVRTIIDLKAPIGVFDSGMGGLTVMKALYKQLPMEAVLYYGDTAHVPYGGRDPKELQGFALRISDYLIRRGCKMIIIACNTSTALAYELINARSPVPVVGVIEPGIRSALKEGGNGPIGVIATQATAQSGVYQRILAREAPERQSYVVACPPFVPLVEAGKITGAEAAEAVRECLTPLKDKGIHSLIFGCTHYPFLSALIQSFLGNGVRLIDPAWETVNQAKAILFEKKYLKMLRGLPEQRFVCSGDPGQFTYSGSFFLGTEIQNVKQVILDKEEEACEIAAESQMS